jgi:hypothetical protein
MSSHPMTMRRIKVNMLRGVAPSIPTARAEALRMIRAGLCLALSREYSCQETTVKSEQNAEDEARRVDEPSGRPPDDDLAYDPEMTEEDEANIPPGSAADPKAHTPT